MIDVAQAIDDETVDGVLKVRNVDTYDAGGNAVLGAVTSTQIRIVVQPVTGKMLMDLPEGVRDQVKYAIWTRSEISMDNEIVYDGETYRVMYLWPRPIDGFFKAGIGKLT